MAEIKISKEKVVSSADQLKSLGGQMRTLLTEIDGLYGKIGSEGLWSGSAAEEAKAIFKELSSNFEHFYGAVEGCSNYLTNVVVPNYDQWEASIAG